jgi:ubiquinone biosynthesis monooxygenase Coq7
MNMDQKNRTQLQGIDGVILEFDRALRAIVGMTPMRRPLPVAKESVATELSVEEQVHAAGLMRVNHVGEVCAQALYQSQKLTGKSEAVRIQLNEAALEEEDHLAWCAKRLEDLNSRPSLLNPFWYAGSFAIGTIAGLAGDRWSLGFVAETERQVEKHLDGHLNELPQKDNISRAIVEQMRADEIAHGEMAKKAGGNELPKLVIQLMEMSSKVMTKIAYKI